MPDDFLENIVQEYAKKPEEKPEEKQPEKTDTPAPTSTESVWNADEFGGKRKEEVIELLSKFPEYETKVTGLSQKVTEYESKLKEIEAKPRYKNPNFYKLDVLSEQEPDKAEAYQKLVFGKTDDQELYKLGILIDFPEYKDNPEFLERRLKRAFPLLYDPDVDQDSQEYQDAKDDLAFEAGKVKKLLQAKIDSIEIPDPQKQAQANEEKMKAFVEGWKPTFSTLSKNNKITINVLSEKDKNREPLFDIELTADESNHYFQKAAQMIVDNGLQPNEESVKKINDFVQKLYVAEHQEELFTKVALHVAKSEGKNWRKAVHNSATPGAENQLETTKPDRQQEVVNQIFANL